MHGIRLYRCAPLLLCCWLFCEHRARLTGSGSIPSSGVTGVPSVAALASCSRWPLSLQGSPGHALPQNLVHVSPLPVARMCPAGCHAMVQITESCAPRTSAWIPSSIIVSDQISGTPVAKHSLLPLSPMPSSQQVLCWVPSHGPVH